MYLPTIFFWNPEIRHGNFPGLIPGTMVRSKCDTSFLNKKINENNQCSDGRKKRRKTRIDTQRLLNRPETESVRRKVTRSSLRLLTRAQGNSKGSFRTGVD